MIEAVVFDLDGVLLDSEHIWDEVREQLVHDRGGRWHDTAQPDMMGMSAPEWSRYMHDELGVPEPPQVIDEEVVRRLEARYRERLPLVSGAVEAIERLADAWPLGLASSSNRPVIELALELAGVARHFRVVISSEEVARGKPAPDVYLEAAKRLSVDPDSCVAVEDSHNGILSAHAARMCVVAIPNESFPPQPEALEQADVVIDSLDALTVELVSACG